MDMQTIRRLLDYNLETGVLRWRERISCVAAGSIAGRPNRKGGYREISVGNRKYAAGRIIWLWVTGEWLTSEIEVDHINGKTDDNRWTNLRLATRGQNLMNRAVQKNSRSGVKGVGWSEKKQRWRARIRIDNRRRELGYFRTLEEAADAYRLASLRIQGAYSVFERPG